MKDGVIKFTLRGIDAGIPNRTPSDEDMDNIPVYDIISPLFWDLYRKLHVGNVLATQQGDNISREQRVIINSGGRRERETRQVNTLAMWSESTDHILLQMLRHSDNL